MARKTTYKPAYCDKLIKHFAQGLSFESFGAEANCSRATLYNWVDKHPDFAEARELGYVKSLKFYEMLGVYGTIGIQEIKLGKKKYDLSKFNTASWIFIMKNRFGWRDKVDFDSESGIKVIFDSPPSQFVNPDGFDEKKKKPKIKKKKNAKRKKTISAPTKAKRVSKKRRKV